MRKDTYLQNEMLKGTLDKVIPRTLGLVLGEERGA